jgi:hypothetical chaperone protein
MQNIISIDFGTSNSTVGYCSSTGPQLIPIEDSHPTIPSAIFFNYEEGGVQFGREAILAYTNHHEGRLLRSLKSVLGSTLLDETTQVGQESISFKEIIARFLRHLKTAAESNVRCEFDTVVLGRPVRFVDGDDVKDNKAQKQLESIAGACGFRTVYFQFEPIAAALDYESRVGREKLALIADIGGGTSDFSIVKVSPENHRKQDRAGDILANSGVHVGGTDFDRALSLSQVMPHLGYGTTQRERPALGLPAGVYFDLATWHRIFLLNGEKTASFVREMHRMAGRPDLVHRLLRVVREQTGYLLAGDVETAKIALSSEEAIRIALPYIDDHLEIDIERKHLDETTSGLKEAISECIQECITTSGVDPDEIETLFMTGGASGMPAVRKCCVAAVPQADLIQGDRFGSVGIGLAINASIRSATSVRAQPAGLHAPQ